MHHFQSTNQISIYFDQKLSLIFSIALLFILVSFNLIRAIGNELRNRPVRSRELIWGVESCHWQHWAEVKSKIHRPWNGNHAAISENCVHNPFNTFFMRKWGQNGGSLDIYPSETNKIEDSGSVALLRTLALGVGFRDVQKWRRPKKKGLCRKITGFSEQMRLRINKNEKNKVFTTN